MRIEGTPEYLALMLIDKTQVSVARESIQRQQERFSDNLYRFVQDETDPSNGNIRTIFSGEDGQTIFWSLVGQAFERVDEIEAYDGWLSKHAELMIRAAQRDTPDGYATMVATGPQLLQ